MFNSNWPWLIVFVLALFFNRWLVRWWFRYQLQRWYHRSSSAPWVAGLTLTALLLIVVSGWSVANFFGEAKIFWGLSGSLMALLAFGPRNIWIGLSALWPAATYLKNRGWGYPLAGLMAGMGLLLTLDSVLQTWSTGTYVFSPWPLIAGSVLGVVVGFLMSFPNRVFR